MPEVGRRCEIRITACAVSDLSLCYGGVVFCLMPWFVERGDHLAFKCGRVWITLSRVYLSVYMHI